MRNRFFPRKTLLALFTVLAFSRCQHQMPINCDDLQFTLTETHTNATLNNPDGSITVTASGGDGFYFNLNGGSSSTTGQFNNLPTGLYTIVGHNAQGCSDTLQVVIGSSNPCQGVTINVTATKTDPSPGQNNGSITASATPSGTYTYSIDGINFQNSGTFSNLAAGNYTVTAKNATGCLGTRQITLTTTNPCQGLTISVSTTQVNPTTGQSNGSITATASPTGTYTYSLNSGAYQTSGTFSNLATGNYTVTAKNADGCTGTTTVALGSTNPCAGITVSVTTSQVNPTTGQSNGSITVTSATPGTGFTYSLNGGAFQSSTSFTGLAAGSYTLTAKNSNGCQGSTTITLVATNPCSGVTITLSATTVNVLPCPQTNGSLALTASGGSAPYTYNKNGGTYQSGGTFSNLTVGNYTMGVKDANGCLGTQVFNITTQPMGPTFTNVRTIIRANCGSCHLNGGNTAGYNFDNDCSIVTYWSQIKGSCVSPYTLRRMPTSAPLSSTLQAQITAWVNAGHRYTD